MSNSEMENMCTRCGEHPQNTREGVKVKKGLCCNKCPNHGPWCSMHACKSSPETAPASAAGRPAGRRASVAAAASSKKKQVAAVPVATPLKFTPPSIEKQPTRRRASMTPQPPATPLHVASNMKSSQQDQESRQPQSAAVTCEKQSQNTPGASELADENPVGDAVRTAAHEITPVQLEMALDEAAMDEAHVGGVPPSMQAKPWRLEKKANRKSVVAAEAWMIFEGLKKEKETEARKSWVRSVLAVDAAPKTKSEEVGTLLSKSPEISDQATGTPNCEGSAMDHEAQPNWEIGDVVKLQGRVGKLTTSPDEGDLVTIAYADGSQSSEINTAYIERGTIDEWREEEVAHLSTEVFEAAEVKEAEAQVLSVEASLILERKMAKRRMSSCLRALGEDVSDDSDGENAKLQLCAKNGKTTRKKGAGQPSRQRNAHATGAGASDNCKLYKCTKCSAESLINQAVKRKVCRGCKSLQIKETAPAMDQDKVQSSADQPQLKQKGRQTTKAPRSKGKDGAFSDDDDSPVACQSVAPSRKDSVCYEVLRVSPQRPLEPDSPFADGLCTPLPAPGRKRRRYSKPEDILFSIVESMGRGSARKAINEDGEFGMFVTSEALRRGDHDQPHIMVSAASSSHESFSDRPSQQGAPSLEKRPSAEQISSPPQSKRRAVESVQREHEECAISSKVTLATTEAALSATAETACTDVEADTTEETLEQSPPVELTKCSSEVQQPQSPQLPQSPHSPPQAKRMQSPQLPQSPESPPQAKRTPHSLQKEHIAKSPCAGRLQSPKQTRMQLICSSPRPSKSPQTAVEQDAHHPQHPSPARAEVSSARTPLLAALLARAPGTRAVMERVSAAPVRLVHKEEELAEAATPDVALVEATLGDKIQAVRPVHLPRQAVQKPAQSSAGIEATAALTAAVAAANVAGAGPKVVATLTVAVSQAVKLDVDHALLTAAHAALKAFHQQSQAEDSP